MKLIIGCGNLLLQDEGIGVHLIEYLKKKESASRCRITGGWHSRFRPD